MHLMRLQAMQIIRRPLRVARRRKDETLIVLQHLQPGRNISGMIFVRLWRDTQIGAQKRATQLGYLS